MGKVERTHYYNVLGMKVDDIDTFVATFGKATVDTLGILNFISHVVPLRCTFAFATAEEFEERARAIALTWIPMLPGKRLSRAAAPDAGSKAFCRRRKTSNFSIAFSWPSWDKPAGSAFPTPTR